MPFAALRSLLRFFGAAGRKADSQLIIPRRRIARVDADLAGGCVLALISRETFCNAYLERYPGTTLLPDRVANRVEEGMDLAIRAGKLKDASLIAKKFFQLEAKPWASSLSFYLGGAGLPRHPKDFSGQRLNAV